MNALPPGPYDKYYRPPPSDEVLSLLKLIDCDWFIAFDGKYVAYNDDYDARPVSSIGFRMPQTATLKDWQREAARYIEFIKGRDGIYEPLQTL